MLSTSATQLSPDIILHLPSDNWANFSQAFKQQCFAKFGVAGQQILSNHTIPIHPFPTAPTKNSLDTDENGLPIPDQFTYPRRVITAAESALPGFNLTNISLSESGTREYREDLKVFTAAARRSSDEDTECLLYLYTHISPTSHTAIKTHASYAQYELLAIGSRSFPFYTMARDIHSIGNATTKLHRTRLLANITQNESSHEEFIDKVTTMAATFTLDFQSELHPGFVSIAELISFFYLSGLNKSQFQRAIDDTLQSTPNGRFPDTAALMAKMQSWKIAQALSFPAEAISTQGSALVAPAIPTSPRTNKSTKLDTTSRTPHLHPTPCTWCLATDKVSRYGHLSTNCSKNPNRIPGHNPKVPNARPPTNTSTRLHALLGQLDVATTPDATNAAMLLIAEAAIEASDFPDAA